MKRNVLRNLTFVLCVALVLGLFAAIPAAKPAQAAGNSNNVLDTYNSSFEGAVENGLPVGWSMWAGSSADVAVTTAEHSDGAQALEIKAFASGASNVRCVSSSRIDVTGWARLEASVDFKAASTAQAQLFIFFYDAEGTAITPNKGSSKYGTGNWEKIFVGAPVPAGAKYADIGVYKHQAAETIYYDNAAIYNASTISFEQDGINAAALTALQWNFAGSSTGSIATDSVKGNVLKLDVPASGAKYARTPMLSVHGLTKIKVTMDIKTPVDAGLFLDTYNNTGASNGSTINLFSAFSTALNAAGWASNKDAWHTVSVSVALPANTQYVDILTLYVGNLDSATSLYMDNLKVECDHTFNKEVVSDEYFASGATTTQAAQYYKSCACGAKGTATFSVGQPLPTQATTAPATTAPATTAPATTAPATTAPATTAGTTAGTTSATTPETGDTTNAAGMMAILLLAVTGMVAMFVGNKKGKF